MLLLSFSLLLSHFSSFSSSLLLLLPLLLYLNYLFLLQSKFTADINQFKATATSPLKNTSWFMQTFNFISLSLSLAPISWFIPSALTLMYDYQTDICQLSLLAFHSRNCVSVRDLPMMCSICHGIAMRCYSLFLGLCLWRQRGGNVYCTYLSI